MGFVANHIDSRHLVVTDVTPSASDNKQIQTITGPTKEELLSSPFVKRILGVDNEEDVIQFSR